MTELFAVADRLESPKGIVIAGADEKLDAMAHDELHKLLSRIQSVSFVGPHGRLINLEVCDFAVTASVGNRRNIFLLLSPETPTDAIPGNGVIIYSEK